MAKTKKVQKRKNKPGVKIPWAKAPECPGATLIGHAFVANHVTCGNSGHFLYAADDSHPAVDSEVAQINYWAIIGRSSGVAMPKDLDWRESFVLAPPPKQKRGKK